MSGQICGRGLPIFEKYGLEEHPTQERNPLQILLMSDMAEFEDLRLELQKFKKKKQSTDVLGKVPPPPPPTPRKFQKNSL
jgi:hypothetical protein